MKLFESKEKLKFKNHECFKSLNFLKKMKMMIYFDKYLKSLPLLLYSQVLQFKIPHTTLKKLLTTLLKIDSEMSQSYLRVLTVSQDLFLQILFSRN